MRKIVNLKVEYQFANLLESKTRLDRFYDWLINRAIDNLLIKNHNTEEDNEKVAQLKSVSKETQKNNFYTGDNFK